MKFEIYPDGGGKYRWRVRAANGRIVASSGESFYSRANAVRAADRFAQAMIDRGRDV